MIYSTSSLSLISLTVEIKTLLKLLVTVGTEIMLHDLDIALAISNLFSEAVQVSNDGLSIEPSLSQCLKGPFTPMSRGCSSHVKPPGIYKISISCSAAKALTNGLRWTAKESNIIHTVPRSLEKTYGSKT